MTMHWSHGLGLVAQILVLWIIVSALLAPQIGRYLRNRRTNEEFRSLLPESPTPVQWGAISVMDEPEATRALAIVDAREPEAKAFALDAEPPRRTA